MTEGTAITASLRSCLITSAFSGHACSSLKMYQTSSGIETERRSRAYLQGSSDLPKRLRYRVEYKVYDAALFGTPQARRRVLIFGVRYGGKEHLPDPGPDLLPLFAAVRHGAKVPTVWKNISRRLRTRRTAPLRHRARRSLTCLSLGRGSRKYERAYASKPKSAFQRWARIGAPAKLRDTRTPAVNVETVKRLRHIPPGGCARRDPQRAPQRTIEAL